MVSLDFQGCLSLQELVLPYAEFNVLLVLRTKSEYSPTLLSRPTLAGYNYIESYLSHIRPQVLSLPIPGQQITFHFSLSYTLSLSLPLHSKTSLTAVTAPLLAAYQTNLGLGLGALILLKLITTPPPFSLKYGTMTLAL